MTCIEWEGRRDRQGYGRAGWRLAHRVAWEMRHGQIPDDLFVLHRCDNPACVNVEHLFLGTHADNMADMVAKGRHPVGEDWHSAKLSDQQIAEIRDRYTAGERQRALAREYGISQPQISKIVNRRQRATAASTQ